MKGFFYEKAKPKAKSIKKKDKINYLSDNPCEACGLDKTCHSPKMKVTGKGKKNVLIIGEAPGRKEDEKGMQFVREAEAGGTLWECLDEIGIDFRRDCFATNAVICRSIDDRGRNKAPTNQQINYCRPNLFKTIQELKPEKIITLGKTPLQSLIGEKEELKGIEKWVGWKIPDQDLGCWIFPNNHPQYLNYNKDDIVLRKIFIKALKEAFEWDKEFPKIKTNVVKLTKPLEASIFLDSLKTSLTPMAIDFETTGKKPQAPGHKILCMSVSTGWERAAAFPIFYEDKSFMLSLKKFLKNPNIKKIGHNIKFENIWSSVILNCNIEGWIWDTMIAAHCEDLQTGITRLKFQTYVHYGVAGYNKEVENFIELVGDGPYGFNRMEEVPLDLMLEYCGMDTIFSYKLFLDQRLEKGNIKGFNLFLEGQQAFSEIEQKGIHIDSKYYEKTIEDITKKQNLLTKKIKASEELKNWKGDFNFNSPNQLKQLLFIDLGYISVKKTKGGDNESTDQEVLKKINTPFTNKILQFKKLDKIKGTYLTGFLRNSFNGKMNPSFNLNMVKSYRSSSDGPNFQNVPVHDEEAQKYTRSGIKPSPGRQLLEVDYSGMEVRVSACVHKDPVMIKYINDPTSDMHRDVAKQLFIKKEVSKEERYAAKNNFVFAEFYGSYYVMTAEALWKNSPEGSIPFSKYSKWERHVQEVEDDFWNKRFRVYNQWKKDIWKKFQKDGVIYTVTGFKISGHLDRKQVANYPIQGPAFHCLLWSLIQLQKYLPENNFDTTILGQIHDSQIFDLVPEEKKKLFPVIRKVSTIDLLEHWKWIIVPMDIDAKISEIDGNWAEMSEIKI